MSVISLGDVFILLKINGYTFGGATLLFSFLPPKWDTL